MIAELCHKHDLLCVSDEVYEWLVHDGEHIRTGDSAACTSYWLEGAMEFVFAVAS